MKKGFTLIELLVVIAIIGILATVVIVNLGSSRKKARRTQLASAAKEVITASNAYIEDNPDTEVGANLTLSNIAPFISSMGQTVISSGITYNTDSSFTFSLTNTGCKINVISSSIPSPAAEISGYSGNSCSP